ncbi:transcriptional regulator [Vespertiliibacter pulmonis]|uniref:LysR family transcriptional regulator n=1 Tax=Vespertiliibacter pulmonis TaxID=1443036 RepID=A0A3N4VQZ4_9PAST|nr:LysR family transcriptional regulator [Vespertiliibacter pulmonis]QLB21141.1 transcriptional regulator [Vespertiliibacter pulmonis]RPE83755.1 LysR family transcriptional regulator [Vespertiliibacter pulmonis]
MFHDYKSISTFATVVEQGSMQAAAEKLNITPSAITQAIQKLELQLGMKLLNRTTRRLSLTEAGELFYQHASQMQYHAENAIHSVEQLHSSPIGELTIACVTGLTDSLFVNMFKSVLNQHAEFRLKLLFDDQLLDLQENRVDLALRAGKGTLSDNMIARHIYDFTWSIVAHSTYIEEKIKDYGEPQAIENLVEWDWIGFSNANFTKLTLQNQQQSHQEQIEIMPNYRIQCNSLYASRSLTLSGLGISIQPTNDVQPMLASGELIQLFPEWQLPTVPLYLVKLQRIQSEKVRLASELIIQYFEQLALTQ